jgi:hypothetical protein
MFTRNQKIRRHFDNINRALMSPAVGVSERFIIGHYYGFETEKRMRTTYSGRDSLEKAIKEVWHVNLGGQLREILRSPDRETLFVQEFRKNETEQATISARGLKEILDEAFGESISGDRAA